MKNILCVIFAGLFSVALSKARAQQSASYDIQANIIYHFTKYIDWPDKSGDFVIGVVGETPLFAEMTAYMAGKMVGEQKIVIRKFPPSATAFSCHILFIPDEESGRVRKIATVTAGMPVLLVTETQGMAHRGACINFIVIDERMKLEINKGNIEQRKLHIASELLALGIIIK